MQETETLYSLAFIFCFSNEGLRVIWPYGVHITSDMHVKQFSRAVLTQIKETKHASLRGQFVIKQSLQTLQIYNFDKNRKRQ